MPHLDDIRKRSKRPRRATDQQVQQFQQQAQRQQQKAQTIQQNMDTPLALMGQRQQVSPAQRMDESAADFLARSRRNAQARMLSDTDQGRNQFQQSFLSRDRQQAAREAQREFQASQSAQDRDLTRDVTRTRFQVPAELELQGVQAQVQGQQNVAQTQGQTAREVAQTQANAPVALQPGAAAFVPGQGIAATNPAPEPVPTPLVLDPGQQAFVNGQQVAQVAPLPQEATNPFTSEISPMGQVVVTNRQTGQTQVIDPSGVPSGLAGPQAAAPEPSAAPSPMPSTKDALQDGQVYQTPRGTARWDAQQDRFIPVNG